MKEFVTNEKLGTLYIDRILLETSYPILFLCKNKEEEHFICVCCLNNSNGTKWLVGKVNPADIIKMLKNEITIRELFLNCTIEKITVDCVDGIITTELDSKDWQSIYLPKEDSYIDAESGEFTEDIEYYETLLG